MPVTIQDISQRLGLSVSTVSKALNQRADVSEETRGRVLAVVQELNYHPIAAARNLRMQRTGKIGFVLPDAVSLTADYISELITGAAMAGEESEKNLLIYTSAANRIEELTRICRTREVDGLLLRGATDFRASAALLRAEGLPFVVLGRRVADPTVSFIAPDNVTSSKTLMRHLIALGHTRIGFTTRPSLAESSSDRLVGYRSALDAADIPFDPDLVVETAIEPGSAYRAMERLLDLPRPPTAVFGVHDLVAIDLLRAAKDRGLRVPEDISVVGHDGVHATLATDPPLTVMRQPLQELGKQAVEMLLTLIDDPDAEPIQRVLPVQLIVRGSSGGVRGRTAESVTGPAEEQGTRTKGVGDGRV